MTRERRHHFKRFWHPHDEARLSDLKDKNCAWTDIAKALDCSVFEAKAKWEEIKPRTDAAEINAADEAYSAACVAQGGFAWWSERCLGMTRANRRKMAVCTPLNTLRTQGAA
jgi:hypothetical protein